MRVNKLITTEIKEENLEWYMKLLDKSYNECITILQQKYGEVRDDYFKQKSYERFLKGEIKKIGKGNYSRAKEGLECHHIFENKYICISNQEAIEEFGYPYELQKKENLVYCDICEHFILHTLITKETNGEFGDGGNEEYLKPKINDWFIEGKVPKPEWMKECIRRAALSTRQAASLLKKSNDMLKDIEEKRRREFSAKLKNMSLEEYDDLLKKEEEERINLARKRDLRMKTEFDKEYPKLKKLNITYNTSRDKILNILYNQKYNENYPDLKAFKSAMINIVRQDLIKLLNDSQPI
ncbi:hypothetical protein [Breznakia pachnodae]|uniref:HNH endonuclease n=1 Tax=Breznakia pachnodae TaxID=265178 RepID=A0ABU0DXS4_9FIRM|nr:hypothetical protein [Breznakia pachnodae]MDQ0359444.1 hypothetical protein [Breznakia pachnodae]